MDAMSMLGAVVEVTGGKDGRVVVDPFMPMLMTGLYLFLLVLPILFILVIVFYRKKYQHQQILAAMEKGIPISELVAKPTPKDREINWVRSLSAGAGFIFMGGILAWLWLWQQKETGTMDYRWLIVPIVIGGIGLIYLLRGILQRNCDKKKQRSEKLEPERIQS